MQFPEELKYTKDHEWLSSEVDGQTAGQVLVGVTDFAQSERGEIVFVELPEVGRIVKAGEAFCVLESTKVASDVYAPVAGVVLEVNQRLSEQPELINSSPYAEGWLVRLGQVELAGAASLLTAAEYQERLKG